MVLHLVGCHWNPFQMDDKDEEARKSTGHTVYEIKDNLSGIQS